MNKILLFLRCATLGPIGYLYAPGTMGSLCALALSVLIKYFSKNNSFVEVLFLFCVIFFAYYVISSSVALYAGYDPSEIVIDEVAGCFIAVYGLPLNLQILAGAFLLFRFFDITKVLGISYIDQNMKGSTGIILDDLVAGLFANILIRYAFNITFR